MAAARREAGTSDDDGGAEIRRTLHRVRSVLASVRTRCACTRAWLEQSERRLRASAPIIRAHADAGPGPSLPALESLDALDALAPGSIGASPTDPVPAMVPAMVAAAVADVWQALAAAAHTDGAAADACERALLAALARALRAMPDADQRDLVATLGRLASALGTSPTREGSRRDRFRPALRP